VRFPLRVRRLIALCSGGLLFLPLAAFADTLNVDIGTQFSISQIFQRVIFFLAASITAIGSAMFVVGAFMIILSGVKEDMKQRGKDLMIGSLLGVGVVLGAYAILRTVAFFIAG
jgi:hypothetical protein